MALKPLNRGSSSSFQAEDFEFTNVGDIIKGNLMEVATLIGKKGRMAGKPFKKYTLKTENGYESFLGCTVLDKTLPITPLGTWVEITYLGYPEGKTYKDFDIQGDDEKFIKVEPRAALPTTTSTAASIVAAARV